MKLRDLFVDPVEKNCLSKTAVWCNVSCLALTVGFIKEAWTHSLGLDTFVGYALAVGIACGAPIANKFVALRYGANGQPPAAPVTATATVTTG